MDSDANRILNFLASAGPYANSTCTPKQIDEIIEATGGQILAQGRLYNIMSKRLSRNVYKLTIKLANP